jgi:hypothetical protein
MVYPPNYKRGIPDQHVSAKELRALGDDLVWIETRLAVHHMSIMEIHDERAAWKDLADIYVPAPWLGTQPQPTPTPPQTPGSKK